MQQPHLASVANYTNLRVVQKKIKMCALRNLICLLSFICYMPGNSDGRIENIPCTLKNGYSGTCQYLFDCKSASDEVSTGKFPQICGFKGLKTIVCCPEIPGNSKTSQSTEILENFQPPLVAELNEPYCKKFMEPGSIRFLSNLTKSKAGRDSRKPGEISAIKCREYAKYAAERVYSQSLRPSRRHQVNYRDIWECAIDNNPLISHGTAAKFKEFPHMATIGFESSDSDEISWSCGGSLISENFVLTAAHCFNGENLNPKYVRLGITNVTDTTYHQRINIANKPYIHPLYIKDKYHDIALIKLEENAKLNPYVRPACLNSKYDITSVTIASGFGATIKNGPLSDTLQKVTLEISNIDNCQNAYKNQQELLCGIIDELMICAGAGFTKDHRRDSCGGDSGGPLQIIHNGNDGLNCTYDIVGVTSFGKACGLNTFKNPGVYTRVSTYIDWIEDIVWPEH